MIDVNNSAMVANARVGLELDTTSARVLVESILVALENAPTDLLDTSAHVVAQGGEVTMYRWH